MKFTKHQLEAIEHDGRNLQLIACAGSGKTEVVARRVVHLLTPGRKDALTPRNIIAFTFTDKAAAELKERVVTRTRQALGEIPGMTYGSLLSLWGCSVAPDRQEERWKELPASRYVGGRLGSDLCFYGSRRSEA